jgi:hypothetical protein
MSSEEQNRRDERRLNDRTSLECRAGFIESLVLETGRGGGKRFPAAGI